MGAEDDDPPWENEYTDDQNAKTTTDGREAVPEPVPSRDTTGKYKTLPGFADAVEQTREHYLALGEIKGMRRVFTVVRLLRIGAGDHPATAEALVEKMKQWMTDNEELINEALKD